MRWIPLFLWVGCGPTPDSDLGPSHDCDAHRTAFRAIDPLPLTEEWESGDTCAQRSVQSGSVGCDIFFREPSISFDCAGTELVMSLEAQAEDIGPLHCGASFEWEERTVELSLRQDQSLVVWDLSITDPEGSCPYRLRYSP